MIALVGFFIGAFLGSLVLCIADRSTTKESFWGRSYCPKCKKTLHWYDLFPILSYLFLKGKCRNCHKKIPFEYPLVEILMGGLIALLFYQQFTPALTSGLMQIDSWSALLLSYFGPFFLNLIFKCFVIAVLVAVLITDIRTYLIPDRITYPSVVVSLIFYVVYIGYNSLLLYLSLIGTDFGRALLQTPYFINHLFIGLDPFLYAIVGATVIGAFFWFLIFITRGRGMGGGDLKLGVFMGLALGFPNCVVALMIAFLLGSLVGVGLIFIRRKKFGQVIPFGPFLSVGSLIALYWGDKIINWYITVKP